MVSGDYRAKSSMKVPCATRKVAARILVLREQHETPESVARILELAGGQNIAALGPYPSRGEYEHCFTLETPKGEFIQLTPTIAEHIARAINIRVARHAHRSGQNFTSGRRTKTAPTKTGHSICW